ncbi:glucokinase [Gammaproteobacteria bacterium 45_16_T64]|nr:glucokinase [Gammaproteobacteria bacterium 45_16_T64]
MLLLVDLGGTNCRCMLQTLDGSIEKLQVYQNDQHQSLENVLHLFLEEQIASITKAAFSIAGPVVSTAFKMTNLDWTIDRVSIAKAIGDDVDIHIVNDFSAVAMSLPYIQSENSLILNGDTQMLKSSFTPKVVLGPGTGLGVGALVPVKNGWAVVSGEGGHVSLSTRTSEEHAVFQILAEKFGHVSAERVISGQGLEQIYSALCQLQGRSISPLSAADISNGALQGDLLPRRALDMMYSFLATVASDLALTFGAKGGVYLAGGILPKIMDDFGQSEFITLFKDKGRFSDYLHTIPVLLITEEFPAFVGLREMLIREDAFIDV